MDRIARAAKEARSELFRATAAEMNFHPVNVEKDFWVCWLLKHLFTIPDLSGWLVFKGGTSLSKCFNLIQRFSEDIDLAIDFEKLGYMGEKDPRQPDLSRTKRQQLLDEMMVSCRQYIAGPFRSALETGVGAILDSGGWSLSVSPSDPNTIEFAYPLSLDQSLAYIQPKVVLELGTHAEPIPHAPFSVRSYVAERYPGQFKEPSCSVETVVARRTFWEKATILHAEYHRPLEKPLLPRYSRHYADVAVMANAAVKNEALADLALLESVVTHKDRFYYAGWARYQEARKGTFRLVPRDERVSALRTDYQAMTTMFFTDPPPLDSVLQELAKLEREING